MGNVYLIKSGNAVDAFLDEPEQYDMVVSEEDWTSAGSGAYIEDGKIVLGRKLSYIDKRLMEYPDISEQLDMLYWDKINNTNMWEDTISAIKAKYPKE